MYDNITVDKLFDYLLKDSKQHRSQLLDDIEAGYLPNDVLNSEILANNKVVTDEINPDVELDRLDNKEVFGDPYSDEDDWLSAVTFEQVDDEDIANQILDNLKKGDTVRDLGTVKAGDKSALHKYASKGDTTAILNTHLDRMLSNIRKDPNLTDDEKKDKALRLVFNINTRGLNTEPVDIRLDQDDIYSELDRAGLIEDYQKLDPTFLEREHIRPGEIKTLDEEGTNKQKRQTNYEKWDAPGKEVPMTYISDKDGDIQLWTPSTQANTVYNVFTDSLINALNAGNEPDLSGLSKYIQDVFANKLKSMTYDDWEKEIMLLHHPKLDLNKIKSMIKDWKQDPRKIDMPDDELSQHIITTVRDKIKQYKDKGFDVNDKMIDGFISAILVANNYDDVPEDVLTPEDFGKFLPDDPKLGKSIEELKDSRLNRWHKDNKEQYKEYLAAKASTVEPKNIFEDLLNKSVNKDAKRAIYKYVVLRYPVIGELLERAEAEEDTATIEKLFPTFKMYHDILDFKNNAEGRAALNEWAHRIVGNRMFNDYGLSGRESYDKDKWNENDKYYKALAKAATDDIDTPFERSEAEENSRQKKQTKSTDKGIDTHAPKLRNSIVDTKQKLGNVLSTLPTDMADRIKYNLMED